MDIQLKDLKFVGVSQFADEMQEDGNNIIFSTTHGNWKKQVIPCVYLESNETYNVGDDLVAPGVMLKISSTDNFIFFCYELYLNFLVEDYDVTKSHFSTFLKVERSDIIGFSKRGAIKFQAVKPKMGTALIGGLGGLPVRGLLPKLMVWGMLKGASKISENVGTDTAEKDGIRYSLEFRQGDTVKNVSIIADTFYADVFEVFLKTYWVAPKFSQQTDTNN